MGNFFIILFGKLISYFSKVTNLGGGSTWPGEIALRFDKRFIYHILQNSDIKIILIAGTNGKTTTSKMLTTILEKSGNKVFQNTSGANLLNGIASSLLLNSKHGGIPYDYGIFEIDENTLPLVLKEITPFAVLLLNLFRDQLDRYGELDSIAKSWKVAVDALSKNTVLILNADDPLVSFIGNNRRENTFYFGLDEVGGKKSLQHASDSIYCPNCGEKLLYSTIFYSHLGIWECSSCKLSRPKPDITKFSIFPLLGRYNKYNTLAAVLTAQKIGMQDTHISDALRLVEPAFGRQEKITLDGKHMQIFLSKNPTGFNENLDAITSEGAKSIMFVLNDQIPDGTDVSWIWDIDLEAYIEKFKKIIISGDRVYDMGLRINYASKTQNLELRTKNDSPKFQMFENLNEAVQFGLNSINESEILYILPTYSAMLEIRKILTGKSIL